MEVAIIYACTKDGIIGEAGPKPLLWRKPQDLKRFKELTMGCPLIMGRHTFDSLPGILPGRPHCVISRQPQELLWSKIPTEETKYYYSDSLDSFIEHLESNGFSKVFIIGGVGPISEGHEIADTIYRTVVDVEVEVEDPAIVTPPDPSIYKLVESSTDPVDPTLTYEVWERKTYP